MNTNARALFAKAIAVWRLTSTSDPFVERLKGYGPLQAIDEARLRNACANARLYPAGYDLIREGDEPGPVFVVLEGWAIRYKILRDGGRQIIAFMMPGDFCDMHVAVLAEMDHNIATLSAAKIATIPRADMEVLVEATPELSRAFWWTQLVEIGVLRSTIVSMGRRNSLERVAHLLCDLCFRFQYSGLDRDTAFVLPFSQVVLADAVGMTAVHVNRVIRKLRLNGALELDRGSIIIKDLRRLTRIAGFDENYLHRRFKI